MCTFCDQEMEQEGFNGYVACPEGEFYKKPFKQQVAKAKSSMLEIEAKSLAYVARGDNPYSDFIRRRFFLAHCGVNGIDRRIAYSVLNVYKKEFFDNKPRWDRVSTTIEDIQANDVIALSYPA